MMTSLRNLLSGCLHQNTTRPLTIRQKNAAGENVIRPSGTYVVCLDCGREFPYSMEKMGVLKSTKPCVTAVSPQATSIPEHSLFGWLSRHVG